MENKSKNTKTPAKELDLINHYDMLVMEGNDPVHDPQALKEYMDRWDGEVFIDSMELNSNKTVLEVGVGTGRLAMRICGRCKNFTGIDISPKTIEKAKINLKEYPNVELINADFNKYQFNKFFDIIYSSLTFMHFENKDEVTKKVWDLLNHDGKFILSIDKNREEKIIFGDDRWVKVFPDSKDKIEKILIKTGFIIKQVIEKDFAIIFVVRK